MRRRLAKRAMTKRNAGIMKIHSYSTSPPHEEVNSRTANSNRRKTQEQQQQQQQQQGNGVDSSERRRQEQQQRQLRPARNSSTNKNHPHNPELGNTTNRLAVRRTQGQEEETLLDDGEETAEEVVVEEEEEEEQQNDGDGDDDDGELAPSAVKRPRLDQQQQQQQAKAVGVGAAAAKATAAGRLAVKVTPRRIKQEVVELVDEQEHEPDEATLGFVHLATGGNQQQQQLLQEEEEREDEEVVDGGEEEEEEEEDDGTSSSTASAEEEIGIEMEPQQLLHLQKGGSRTAIATGGRVQLSRGSSASVGRGTTTTTATTTILMTEEDYEQHQQEQEEQQQHGDDEDVAMDDYEGAVSGAAAPGGSEDMEDTDGALTGNRLFRKKVKRKLHTRTNSASVASGSLVGGGGTNSITSSKGKLQMLQEFPTLFIGLRRNRMFLVNSLAQSFDLNQRDIVLTLRKIKQNESSARLANFFGIGAAEVDLLFHTSVPKIADCLRNFIVWPDDFTMKLNVPVSLRQHFNRIHLILNYLVLRVKQNAVQQLPAGEVELAYCPVDQCHKLKYLVASTLDGCVCFVSRAFGVQTDDEQLLAQSGFLTKFKTNTNLIAGQNFHNFEDRLANGHDHANNNGGGGGGGGRNRRSRGAGTNDDDDSDLERVLGNCDEDNFEDIVSEKISKSRTFKLKNYIENILENFQNHQMLSPHTCIDGRTFKLLDDIVVIVGALINLQKQEID